MAKKYLDLTGLQAYTVKIKGYADTVAGNAAAAVDTAIREDYKIKTADNSDTVNLTVDANGKLTAAVVKNYVLNDADYSTVKANANNSAAAWTKFLDGSSDVAPALKDLITSDTANANIAQAKGEAITEAGKLDAALEAKIAAAYAEADGKVKEALIGKDGDADTANTIYGAKKYAENKAAAAAQDAAAAQGTADTALANAAAAQGTADTAVANAATAQAAAEAAQGTADTAVANAATAQAAAEAADAKIDSTKSELIGASTDAVTADTIHGAKNYAANLADGLSKRVDAIVAGGVTFVGVLSALPETPVKGNLFIADADIVVGDKTYKKDYEYIYDGTTWYELGDSDKNAKAIADLNGDLNDLSAVVSGIDAAYKKADEDINAAIENVDKAAVKSLAGGNSTYVTVTAGAKDASGKITLTVSDSIADTFITKVDSAANIGTAKSELIGTDADAATANTIYGAKAYAAGLVGEFERITETEINGLFD